MRNARNKQKNRRRQLVSQEQIAQNRLIQISVMPENQRQSTEIQMFSQKLQSKYHLKTQPVPRKRSSLPKFKNNYSAFQQSSTKKTCHDFLDVDLEEMKYFRLHNVLTVSKIPIVCSNEHVVPKNSVNRLRSNSSENSYFYRNGQRRMKSGKKMSLNSLKLKETCDSMRTRIKQGVNQKVVQAFQIKNIPLHSKFQKYIKQYQILKYL